MALALSAHTPWVHLLSNRLIELDLGARRYLADNQLAFRVIIIN